MVDIISELFFFHNSFKATIRPKHIEPILRTPHQINSATIAKKAVNINNSNEYFFIMLAPDSQ